MTDLVSIARSLCRGGKGILAADESVASATKRLAAYGIATGSDMRRKFRDLFFGTDGIDQYLSGIILFSETLGENGADGGRFPESLIARGIAPGVKVDLGTEPLSESPSELITQGLLDLPERLLIYKKQGAVFTKWRAVVTIDGDTLPSALALHENAKRLAQYAKVVQTVGMVPILEPEVLLTGNHSRARAREVIVETMGTLFSVLEEFAVDKASLIVKTSMALSGDLSGKSDTPEEVAHDTVDALIESVPRQVAGIVFLSGGQTPVQAIRNLAAITATARAQQAPWPLTFSYARALQEDALALWKGADENVPAARAAFLARLKEAAAAIA